VTRHSRLHVGPAGSYLPGWVNVGPRDDPRAEITTDLAVDGIPLPSGSVYCASSSLVLHQFTPYEALGILRDLRRVLAADGVLRLCLVDLDRALEAYRYGGSGLWCHAWASPAGNLVTQILEHGAARTPYTPGFTSELLHLAGFVEVRAVGDGETMSAVAEIVEGDTPRDDVFRLEATAPALPAGTPHDLAPRLCWTADPRTSLSVIWRTSAPDGVSVEVDQGEGWRHHWPATTRARWGGFVHTAEITSLQPGQSIRYRLGAGEAVQTGTAPADTAACFRFAFVCDTGIAGRRDGLANGTQRVVDELVDRDPLFVLGGGDYAYADSDERFLHAGAAVDAWVEQFRPLTARSPMVLQFGNHEVSLGERWLDYAELVPGPGPALGGRCQSFDAGAAHLAGVFAPDESVDAEVVQWLEDDLGRARAAGAGWLVVWQHSPLFASGSAHPAAPRLRRQLGPTLERHAVDLHLSGHDQNYERTFPLLGVAGTPTIVSRSADRYQAGDGVVYAKVSPGGKHSNRGGASLLVGTLPASVARWNDAAHHLALVTVEGEDRLEVEVLELGPGSPTQAVDHFVIERAAFGR